MPPADGVTAPLGTASLQAELVHYDKLTTALRLPRVELELYDYLFVDRLRHYVERENLGGFGDARTLSPAIGALSLLLDAIGEHARRTLLVMQQITHREDVIARLIACNDFYEGNGCPLEDAQETFLFLLQEHQMATLLVVEAVLHWREQLVRPFAFNIRPTQENYLLRIQAECVALTRCVVGQSLNIHLDRFPCCSNVDMQRVCRRKRLLRRTKIVNTGEALHRGLEPLAPPPVARTALTSRPPLGREREASGCLPVSGPALAQVRRLKHNRLLACEQAILKEGALQDRLSEELWDVVQTRRCFVPLLSIPRMLMLRPEVTEKGDAALTFTNLAQYLPLAFEDWDELQLDEVYCASVASEIQERVCPLAAHSITPTEASGPHNKKPVMCLHTGEGSDLRTSAAKHSDHFSPGKASTANTYRDSSDPNSTLFKGSHGGGIPISDRSSASASDSSRYGRRSSFEMACSPRRSSHDSRPSDSSDYKAIQRRPAQSPSAPLIKTAASTASSSASSSTPSSGSRKMSQSESLEELRKQLLAEWASSSGGTSLLCPSRK